MIDISIVVPAYKEKDNIAKTIQALEEYARKQPEKIEIIIAIDGCQETFDAAYPYESDIVSVNLSSPNQGKGWALKYGLQFTKGKYVVFYDAGLDFPVENISLVIATLQITECPIVIGSKRAPGSVIQYPFHRRIVSAIGQLVTFGLFGLGVRDTQVGLKGFEREKITFIMDQMVVKRYAFDIEMLVLARYYKYDILEVPVRLYLNFQNSGINYKTTRDTLIDTLGIFYRLRILRYYQRQAKLYRKKMKQATTEIVA
jgi:glycosyltransferase involved in cell wall biosynthesis